MGKSVCTDVQISDGKSERVKWHRGAERQYNGRQRAGVKEASGGKEAAYCAGRIGRKWRAGSAAEEGKESGKGRHGKRVCL